MQQFYSHGKLLISGEYLVLHGALALALPCKFGQHMQIDEQDAENNLHWKNFDEKGNVWADVLFSKNDFSPYRETLKTIHTDVYAVLQKLLNTCRKLNPHFLKTPGTTTITNTLEFPLNWGLGSSSTLINNIAQFAGIDAFKLNAEIFNGSGYDIACAQASKPVLYKIDEEGPAWETVNFIPPQPENIFFIHSDKKQNSKTEVQKFEALNKNFSEEKQIVSEISEALLFCDDFKDFILLLDEHEEIMQFILQEEKIKTKLFADFNGAIKSLGAWGGDFIMAASEMKPGEIKNYFLNKGYKTILNYSEMVL